jgi:hypothetical protein
MSLSIRRIINNKINDQKDYKLILEEEGSLVNLRAPFDHS